MSLLETTSKGYLAQVLCRLISLQQVPPLWWSWYILWLFSRCSPLVSSIIRWLIIILYFGIINIDVCKNIVGSLGRRHTPLVHRIDRLFCLLMSHSAPLSIINGYISRLGPLMLLSRLFVWKLINYIFGNYTFGEWIDHITSVFAVRICPTKTIFSLLLSQLI